MAIVLAALSLLGLGIFGPGIANGLVSGGPQLGAGAAVGTGLAVGGAALAVGGAAKAAGSAAISPLKRAASKATESITSSFSDGAKSAFETTGGSSTMGTIGGAADTTGAPSSPAGNGPPAWAKRMNRSQGLSHGVSAAAHAVRSGDSHSGGSSINLSESDR